MLKGFVMCLFVGIAFVSCSGDNGDDSSSENITVEEDQPVCNSGKIEKEIIREEDSISIVYRYYVDDYAVGFTNQPEEKWNDEEWLDKMYAVLDKEKDFNVVILFNNHDHTPNLQKYCLDYPKQFNRNLVLGYWRYAERQNKFCFGGSKVDGTFYHCVYKD